MRFTSLVVELIRARPRLVVWIVVLAQAGLWLFLPMLLYRSPPGDLATALAFGREYQVGTWLGPPLAFWLADIAFRAAGNTMFGVYLLAQVCAVVTFWIYYQLARAIVGGQQAVLAVLLSITVVAFSSPGVEFGPLVLARPLWALLLLHSWQLIGQNRRNAWFAWSIEAGLLLLTTSAAPWLLLLLAGFAVATARGRRVLMSLDPLYALLVIAVLVLPYLIWLLRADALAMPPWPAISDLGSRALQWGELLIALALAMSAIVLLAILNSGWFSRHAEDAPIIYRLWLRGARAGHLVPIHAWYEQSADAAEIRARIAAIATSLRTIPPRTCRSFSRPTCRRHSPMTLRSPLRATTTRIRRSSNARCRRITSRARARACSCTPSVIARRRAPTSRIE